MSELKIVCISVGNGDSIFLHYTNDNGGNEFGLIDCNDSVNLKSTHIFLKRYFESFGFSSGDDLPEFEMVMLSHAHGDHISGLKEIIRLYGTNNFYYSSNIKWGGHAPFMTYIKRTSKVNSYTALDSSSSSIQFGGVQFSVLWPINGHPSSNNENNNSLVILLKHNNTNFLFCGDAEYDVWNDTSMINTLQQNSNLNFFKVPHHGAENGTIDQTTGQSTWPIHLNNNVHTPISSHVVPYSHPDQNVINALSSMDIRRTEISHDQNVEYISDGTSINVRYFQ